MRSYLQFAIDEHMRRGLTPRELQRAAHLDFGGVDQVKESVRSVRAGALVETLCRDLGYAVRMLRKNPGFAGSAIITIALGIGVNTAIFCRAERGRVPPSRGGLRRVTRRQPVADVQWARRAERPRDVEPLLGVGIRGVPRSRLGALRAARVCTVRDGVDRRRSAAPDHWRARLMQLLRRPRDASRRGPHVFVGRLRGARRPARSLS